MWYVTLYYLIFVKQFVITLAPQYRPIVGMATYQQQLYALNPNQPVQFKLKPTCGPVPLPGDSCEQPTTCSINDEYIGPGVRHSNNMVCDTVKPQYFQDNSNHPILRQLSSMQRPFQPPIQKYYQIPMQPQYRMPNQLPIRFSIRNPRNLPVMTSVKIPNESPSRTSIQMQMPFHAPNRMTVQQLEYLRQETWPIVAYTFTTTDSAKPDIKKIRKPKLRDNKNTTKKRTTLRLLKMSSSTRPPYPGGIRPETQEIEGDYVLCDGNAVCHKYVWTTKKAKTIKKTRRRHDLVLIKSFINK
ncbi:hypothetical protein HW555_003323 [Spodoptera exigua]|uniref:Uncharacterized protein n=1 Tax=Spodoptera exigua TaxID=7107 RepID=A0A835L699_SPOEX|nr:hypothetical protein HW555_003323 [Spodoptera exigua]